MSFADKIRAREAGRGEKRAIRRWRAKMAAAKRQLERDEKLAAELKWRHGMRMRYGVDPVTGEGQEWREGDWYFRMEQRGTVGTKNVSYRIALCDGKGRRKWECKRAYRTLASALRACRQLDPNAQYRVRLKTPLRQELLCLQA